MTTHEKILVTGGAGFIGSHLVDALILQGYQVRVLDNLEPQVHGQSLSASHKPPAYLNPQAEFIYGDVRDKAALNSAMTDIDAVFHEAAAVGVGQSMYEIERYVGANTFATSTLLENIVNRKPRIRKLIIASSMSIYGEGLYTCATHGKLHPKLRTREQLMRHDWEMHCPLCGESLRPIPTDEEKPLYSTSIYAITKKDQEEMSLCIGRAYDIPTVALRYFNTYGPRQSLSNPYTGVAAVFAAHMLNDKSPVIYEDGNQRRDFVHVGDIVQANLLALQCDAANGQVFNISSGQSISIGEVAKLLAQSLNKNIDPTVNGKFRAGDIRHCFADISKAQRILGFQPRVSFNDGIVELVDWLLEQRAPDYVDHATTELEQRGLTR